MELLALLAPLLLMIAAGASAHRRNRHFWQASFQAAAISTAMLTVGLLVFYAELLPRPVDADGLIVVTTLFIGTVFVSWVVALFVGLYFAGYRPFEQDKQEGGNRFIPRFTIMQMLMTTAFVAIVLTFLRTEGRIHYGTYIESMGFLANGEQLAVAKLNASGRGFFRSKFARTISILRADNGVAKSIGSEVHALWHGPRYALATPGKSSIATVPSSNELYAMNFGASDELIIHATDSEMPSRKILLPDYFMNFALSADRSRIGIFHYNILAVFDVATAQYISQKPDWKYAPLFGAAPMSFSENGSLLAAGGYEGVEVWDIATGVGGFVLEFKNLDFPAPVQFVPRRSMLAVGVKHGVELYDLQGQLVHRFPFAGPCRAIAASPDGKLVAAAYETGVALFDVDALEQVRAFDWSDPSCLSFSPNGKQLAVGDFNGLVTLVDVSTGNQLWQVSPPSAESWTWTVPYAMLGTWVVACIGLAWRKTRVKATIPSEPPA